MRKLSTIILSFCITILFGSCSWVDDDMSKCPNGNWLKLSYTYNMLNVDAASTQLGDVTLFIYNQAGSLIHKEKVDSLNIHDNDCIIKLPNLPVGIYDFVVWGGLDDDNYTVVSNCIELIRDSNNINNKKLRPLFHGRLDNIHIDDNYAVHNLFLAKLTNVFSCVLQGENGDFISDATDFDIEIISNNAVIDNRNNVVGSNFVTYSPFFNEVTTIENIDVIHSGLNTLRLLENDNTRFRLIYKPSNEDIIDIPLTDYLLMSRHIDYLYLSNQEYLDREDRYNIIFFLQKSDNPQQPPYICLKMMINSWVVRMNDTQLESCR